MKPYFLRHGTSEVVARCDHALVGGLAGLVVEEREQASGRRKQKQWKDACCASIGALFEVALRHIELPWRWFAGSYA